MLVYGFLLILLLRPSWGLWGWFSLVAAALLAVFGWRAGYDFATLVVYGLIQGAIFAALGALIVFLRLKSGRSRKDGEIEAELERIRAEAPAREAGQPPQAQ